MQMGQRKEETFSFLNKTFSSCRTEDMALKGKRTAKIMLKSKHRLVKRSTISTQSRPGTAGRQNILVYFKNNNLKRNVLQD